MRICIHAASCAPIESEDVEVASLGLGEQAILCLAKALSTDHEVILVSSHPQPRSNKIKFLTAPALESVGPLDIYCVVKDWIPLFFRVETKVKSLWIPRGADEFSNMGVGDLRVVKAMDALVVSDELDRDGLAHAAAIPKEKIRVIGDPALEKGLTWAEIAKRFATQHEALIREKKG